MRLLSLLHFPIPLIFPILPLPHYHIPTLSHFISPPPSGHSPAIRPPLGRRASLVVVRWFSLLTVLRHSPRDARFSFSCARSMWWSRFFSPAVCGGSERSLVRFRLGSRLASTNDREKRNQTPRRRQSCENCPSFVPLSSLARRGALGCASPSLTRNLHPPTRRGIVRD